VALQDRGRTERRDWPFHGPFDGCGLARIRHGADDAVALHDLRDGHRDRLCGHLIQRREPALAHLLAAAGFVQCYNQIRRIGLEIGRRVIEGQMAVLAASYSRDINRRGVDQLSQSLALRLKIRRLAIDLDKGTQRGR